MKRTGRVNERSVVVATEFTHIFAGGRQVPVQVEVGWSPGDPHAVQFWFPRQAQRWFMARELVVAGLTSTAAGEGDVRFWCPADCPGCVGIELESPTGHATFHAPRTSLIDLIVASDSHGDVADPFAELDAWLAQGLP